DESWAGIDELKAQMGCCRTAFFRRANRGVVALLHRLFLQPLPFIQLATGAFDASDGFDFLHCCFCGSAGSLGQPALWPNQRRATPATCMQSSDIRWDWDDLKATMNLRKHKVSFDLAAHALAD